MSRLPRIRSSSPDRNESGPSLATRVTLKRKATIDEEQEGDDQPRKLPAIGASRPNRTLQPSRTAINLAASTGKAPSPNLPKPLTKPRAPALTRSTTTRGTSAPPVGAAGRVAAKPTSARGTTGRTVSGPLAGGRSSDDKRFNELQSQLTSIENARAADAARLAADMEAERDKVAELQANHLALSRELATAKSQEINQRRELVHASDEIENLKKKHAREIMDLEMDVKKRDRVIREVSEDLRMCRSDLERERETVSTLKSTISHQSTSQLTLTTQNQAMQAQSTALQSQIDVYARTVSELTLKLESAQKEVDDLKKEAMESETVRRKLHNMVQELKGNIRVFCRVRPVLPSDYPCGSPSSPSGGVAAEDLQANMAFPDRRDHKEIVLASSSESATGQQRNEVYNFGFDRVSMSSLYIYSSAHSTQVFEPESTQAEVFEEVSMLAQSCTDGYNVCIFAYGQTGSGKSFTMEGGLVRHLCFHSHLEPYFFTVRGISWDDSSGSGTSLPRRGRDEE
jgi:kinesin family protein C1